MPFYTSRGQRLHYEVVGEGKPVLFIHGFTNYGMVWAGQLAALVYAGYQAIMPDLAGHGLSQHVAEPVTIADLADDMVALLDALGVAQAVVCGLSLGGYITQQMLVDHPGRVSAALIADSRAETDEHTREVVAGWIEKFEGPGGPLARLDAAWPVLFNDAFRAGPAGQALLDAWRPVLAAIPGSSLANVARGMSHFTLVDRLPAVRVPTLVVCGEHDRLMPSDASARLAALIPAARYEVIPGGGHICSVDSPGPFNRLLLGFLEEEAAGLCPAPVRGQLSS